MGGSYLFAEKQSVYSTPQTAGQRHIRACVYLYACIHICVYEGAYGNFRHLNKTKNIRSHKTYIEANVFIHIDTQTHGYIHIHMY